MLSHHNTPYMYYPDTIKSSRYLVVSTTIHHVFVNIWIKHSRSGRCVVSKMRTDLVARVGLFDSILLFLAMVPAVVLTADQNGLTGSCCSDGFGLNYTLPMGRVCQGGTIPKWIAASPAEAATCRGKSKIGIPPGRGVCRFPDCNSNPCMSAWCEETMTGFECHESSDVPARTTSRATMSTTAEASTNPVSSRTTKAPRENALHHAESSIDKEVPSSTATAPVVSTSYSLEEHGAEPWVPTGRAPTPRTNTLQHAEPSTDTWVPSTTSPRTQADSNPWVQKATTLRANTFRHAEATINPEVPSSIATNLEVSTDPGEPATIATTPRPNTSPHTKSSINRGVASSTTTPRANRPPSADPNVDQGHPSSTSTTPRANTLPPAEVSTNAGVGSNTDPGEPTTIVTTPRSNTSPNTETSINPGVASSTSTSKAYRPPPADPNIDQGQPSNTTTTPRPNTSPSVEVSTDPEVGSNTATTTRANTLPPTDVSTNSREGSNTTTTLWAKSSSSVEGTYNSGEGSNSATSRRASTSLSAEASTKRRVSSSSATTPTSNTSAHAKASTSQVLPSSAATTPTSNTSPHTEASTSQVVPSSAATTPTSNTSPHTEASTSQVLPSSAATTPTSNTSPHTEASTSQVVLSSTATTIQASMSPSAEAIIDTGVPPHIATTLDASHSFPEEYSTTAGVPSRTTTISAPSTLEDIGDIGTSSSTFKDVVFVADFYGHKIWMADVSDMAFTSFLDMDPQSKPRDVTFHTTDQQVYWTDHGGNEQIWRTDPVNGTPVAVSSGSQGKPYRITISESRGFIYCSYTDKNYITSIQLGDPGSEIAIIPGADEPRALEVDDHEEYLYWTEKKRIKRITLVDLNSTVQTIYYDDNLEMLTGLSIDQAGSRIFFYDSLRYKAFYIDVGATDSWAAVEMTGLYPTAAKLFDVCFFNGAAYWTTRFPEGVAVMTDMSNTSLTYTQHIISEADYLIGIYAGRINF